MSDPIRRRMELHAEMAQGLLEPELVAAVLAVGEAIVDAYRRGNKVVLFGNGGSAVDAQHIAAELTGRFLLDRAPLSALALVDNIASLTAISNDYDYAQVFARQLGGLASAGDVAVGLSTSGTSENVLEAMRAARRQGLVTVAITGPAGDRLAELVDLVVRIPSPEPPQIQEGTMAVCHAVCEHVERELFG